MSTAQRPNRERPSAYDQAVRLLARRDHAEAELIRKLRQRDYDPREIDEAVEQLREDRYLDDHRTAALWAEQERRRAGQGREKALARMVQHGLPADIARVALDEVWDGDDDRNMAREAATRIVRSLSASKRAGSDGRARVIRRLLSRGFSADVAREAADRALATHSREDGTESEEA